MPFRVKPMRPSFADRIKRRRVQEFLADDPRHQRPRRKGMVPTIWQLSDARDHWTRGLHELAPFVQDYTDKEMSTLRELLAELRTVPTSEELAVRYNTWESVPGRS